MRRGNIGRVVERPPNCISAVLNVSQRISKSSKLTTYLVSNRYESVVLWVLHLAQISQTKSWFYMKCSSLKVSRVKFNFWIYFSCSRATRCVCSTTTSWSWTTRSWCTGRASRFRARSPSATPWPRNSRPSSDRPFTANSKSCTDRTTTASSSPPPPSPFCVYPDFCFKF